MSRPIRVLLIAEACGGGAGRHVLDLSEGLVDRGCEVHLIHSPHRADAFFRERLSRAGALRHACCPLRRNIHSSDLTALRSIRRYARDFGPFDIIHGHSAKGGALARLAAIGSGTPVLYTPHGFILMDPSLPWRERLLYHAVEWALSKLTDRIIAVSPEERRFAIRRGLGRSRVVLIPNGIDPIAFPPRAVVRRSLGLSEDSVVTGFIGRLVDQKAPDVLLRAFAMAARRVARSRLVIVGSGPLDRSLRHLADGLGIGESILWLGECDGKAVLPAFDLFAIASRKEGLPYVVLEALAAGLPILATASAGVELLVRHGGNGWIVSPDRPDVFGDALGDLLGDLRRLARYGRASRDMASRFTTEEMVDRTIAAYECCLQESGVWAGASTGPPGDRPPGPFDGLSSARRPPRAARGIPDGTSRSSSSRRLKGDDPMASKPRSAEMHPGPGFRVRMDIPRPDRALFREFQNYATPDISDLLNRLYAMDPCIRCLTGSHHVLCGPACTVKLFPGDNLMVHKALDVAHPGDIVVVDAGGSTQNAVLGDLISTKARHREIAGFIVDGLIRDLPAILPLDFPVFARGVTPIGPLHRGPGEINFPICCGGVVVNPGDIIVADAAGIIVVPREIASELLARLRLHDQTNRAYLESVRRGDFSNRWVDQLLEEHQCSFLAEADHVGPGRNATVPNDGGWSSNGMEAPWESGVLHAVNPEKDLV
jgi:RraA family protein